MQTYRPAPLRLKELLFPKVYIEALLPGSEEDQSPRTLDLDTTDISFLYQPDYERDIVSVGMRLQTRAAPDEGANPNPLYALDLEAFAVFDIVGSEHRDGMAEYLRKVAAASALLGAIREQVAITTARGPWGALTIPLVGMDAIVGRPPTPTKEKAAAKNEQVAPAERKPRSARKAKTGS